MLSIIAAPDDRPQIDALVLAGVQHPLAPEVLADLRRRGSTPVRLWKLINALALARKPDYRAQHRCWRLRYWRAVLELRRAGLLFRHRSWIALADFAIRPGLRTAIGLSLSAPTLACKNAGSKQETAKIEAPHNDTQAQPIELVEANQRIQAGTLKTQNAKLPTEVISAAASLMAMRLRPRKRKWTGVLNGERIRRNTLVQVPSGVVRPAYVVLRHKVYVVAPENSGRLFDRYDVSEVTRIKNQAAQLMGRLKGGKHERRSRLKQESARRNGRLPPRAGSRPRGRPRKHNIGYLERLGAKELGLRDPHNPKSIVRPPSPEV